VPGKDKRRVVEAACWPYNRPVNSVDIEQRLRRVFVDAAPAVVTAYLFGSVARGTAHERSDVDVAVLLEVAPPSTLAGLQTPLEDALADHLGQPVQLVVLNTAPPDLVHRVLRDGRLLVDRNPSRRIAFEVRARNEFFDLDPILERYRAAPARGR
jgi:predicted nucleotidyltransferase